MRYSFGDFVLDAETGELLRSGEVVTLRRQTFRLLHLLIERAPALLSRDTLLDEVWGRTALATNAVPQAISELRRALGDDARSPQYIETRHGRGYRLLMPVRRESITAAQVEHVEPSPDEAIVHHSPEAPIKSRRWLVPALVLVFLLAIPTLLVWRSFAPSRGVTMESPVHSATLALAVLPADAGVPAWVSGAALELFGQHLAGAQTRLLRSDALGLAASPLDTRWQHQAHDLLGADYAIGGRWRSGEHDALVLDLSVVDLSSGQLVISRKIAGQADDLDALVAEASAAISASLRLTIDNDRDAAARPQAPDRAAYWSALAALNEGHAGAAATELRKLYAQLGKPVWIESALVDALAQAGQSETALAVIDARLKQGQSFPLGERLRLQAKAAELRHQPSDAAAALRALVELYPDDIESWMRLVERELDALQGSAARTTLARLASLPATRNDPRLSLLRSRLARLDNDFALAQREAASALQKATEYNLPKLAISASIAQADAMRGEGKLDDGARLLAMVDATWSARSDVGSLLDLRLRQVQLLREQGRMADALLILDRMRKDFPEPLQQARMGVDQALVQAMSSQTEAAEQTLQRIKPVVDQSRDPGLGVAWLNADGVTAIGSNDADRAQRSFEEAFKLARNSGRAGQSVALQVNAGLALMRQRRFAEADALWQQALEIFESLGDRRGQATCLGNLAASASTQGQLKRSIELNVRALKLFRDLRLSGPQARTAYNLALGAERDGKLKQARDYFKEAGDAWTADGQKDFALRAAIGQSNIALLSGNLEAAKRIIETVAQIEGASALNRSHLLAMQSRIAFNQGSLAESRHLQERALLLRKQDGNEGWIALSELELLRNDLLTDQDATRVQIAAENLVKRFSTLRETRDEARAWLLVADAQLTRAKIEDARRSLDKVKAASESFSDRTVAFDLEWSEAWASDADERGLRLRALKSRASEQGYLLQALRVDRALAFLSSTDSKSSASNLPLPPYARASAIHPL